MVLELNQETQTTRNFTPGESKMKTSAKASEKYKQLGLEDSTTNLERIDQQTVTKPEVVTDNEILPTDAPDFAQRIQNHFQTPLEKMTTDDLVKHVQEIEDNLQHLNYSHLEKSIVSGRLLIQLKQQIKQNLKQSWPEYLKTKLPGIPPRTAIRRMQFANATNWHILEQALNQNPALGVVDATKLLAKCKPAKSRGKSPTPEAERRKAIKSFVDQLEIDRLMNIEFLVDSIRQYLLTTSPQNQV